MADLPSVMEALTDEECYLYTILQDHSGIDLAEFAMVDESRDDGIFRCWAVQVAWWRDRSPLQVDSCGRSIGKTSSIVLRAMAFPFVHPGQEMLITAPELIHLEPITNLIENKFYSIRILREMLPQGRSAITHRPFLMNCVNSSRIIGRIPQRTGAGVKGSHPIALEMDECFPAGTLILTKKGMMNIEDIQIGDEVLTHKRRWRPVLNNFIRERPTVVLKGHGHPGFRASINHKFWGIRDQGRTFYKVDSHLEKVDAVSAPTWITAEEMEGNYWCSPTVFPQVKHVPRMRKPGTSGKIPCFQTTPGFFWMVGLWLAEGSYSEHASKVHFSIHVDEVSEVMERLQGIGLCPWVSGVQSSELCKNVNVASVALGEWLVQHCHKGALQKEIPPWALGLKREWRQALLDGLLYGDGFKDKDVRYQDGRYKLSTSSRKLAITSRLLGNSLDYWVTCFETPAHEGEIGGHPVHSKLSYQVCFNKGGQGFNHYLQRYTRVKEVIPTNQVEVLYDLEVAEDHSFIAEGFCVSNSQDYPSAGWTELIETLKRGHEGAIWRSHGVTRGLRDDFYKITQDTPDNQWKVHRFSAMWRDTWTDEERQEKIKQYGSRDDPDYKRNILGLAGDNVNPIFSSERLFACADSNELSEYNTEEYYLVKTKAESLVSNGQVIEDILDFPYNHREYLGDPRNPKAKFWVGMDVGFAIDPSEILVFVEYMPKKTGDSLLKLLTRVHNERMSHHDQVAAILRTIDFYRPKAFSMDKGGLGLPLFQDIQGHAQKRPEIKYVLDVIKGYNFSEKVIVEFDESVQVKEFTDSDQANREQGIRRNIKEGSTDTLRGLVDAKRLRLPWDAELLKQFQGGTWTNAKGYHDQYGRKRFNAGDDHCIAGGTLVNVVDGVRPIEDIKVNDSVLTRKGFRRVIDAWQVSDGLPVHRIIAADGSQLSATAEHRVWTRERAWAYVDTLEPGETLLGLDGKLTAVESIERLPDPVAVYDLTVEGEPEFFAGGILVHNCLDAARFAVFGWAQYAIEQRLKQPVIQEPVLDMFVGF